MPSIERPNSMHVLVAGGSGFVGRAMVPELLAAGHRVTVLTRDPQRAAARLRRLPGVDAATVADGRSATATAVAGGSTVLGTLDYGSLPVACDAIVNLAGANLFTRRWTKSRKELLWRSRIDTTRRLVEAWRSASTPPAVLVNASAVGYYGDRGDQIVDESTPPDEQDFLGQLCVQWEQEALRARELGMRVVLLRFGVVLGRGGGALLAMQLPTQLFVGARLGSGRQYMPWVHIADVTQMVRWALENVDTSGAYDTTSPEPCTNAELCRALAAVLRRPCWLRVPAAVLRVLLGEVARYVLWSQRVVPARALREGHAFRFPQLRAALADLYERR